MNYKQIELEIIKYIQDFHKTMEIQINENLSSNSLLLESISGFDSLELAGLVAHLEELTNFDPFEGGFVEFESIGELAKLFSAK